MCAQLDLSDVIEVLLAANPAAARTVDSEGDLPLHVAMEKVKRKCDRLAAPAMVALVQANPDAAKVQDQEDCLPLHLAVGYLAVPEVIHALLRSFPGATQCPDQEGRLPIVWFAMGHWSHGRLDLTGDSRALREGFRAVLDATPDGIKAKFDLLGLADGEGDEELWPLLHMAAYWHAPPPIIEVLLETDQAAAQVPIRTSGEIWSYSGMLPFHLALERSDDPDSPPAALAALLHANPAVATQDHTWNRSESKVKRSALASVAAGGPRPSASPDFVQQLVAANPAAMGQDGPDGAPPPWWDLVRYGMLPAREIRSWLRDNPDAAKKQIRGKLPLQLLLEAEQKLAAAAITPEMVQAVVDAHCEAAAELWKPSWSAKTALECALRKHTAEVIEIVLSTFPASAKIWLGNNTPEELPLHLALERDDRSDTERRESAAPKLLPAKTILAVLGANRDAAREPPLKAANEAKCDPMDISFDDPSPLAMALRAGQPTAVIAAVLAAHPDAVKQQCREPCGKGARAPYGGLPLHFALYHRASPESTLAILEQCPAAAKAITQSGAWAPEKPNTALYTAIQAGASAEVVSALLKHHQAAAKQKDNGEYVKGSELLPFQVAIAMLADEADNTPVTPALCKAVFDAYPAAAKEIPSDAVPAGVLALIPAGQFAPPELNESTAPVVLRRMLAQYLPEYHKKFFLTEQALTKCKALLGQFPAAAKRGEYDDARTGRPFESLLESPAVYVVDRATRNAQTANEKQNAAELVKALMNAAPDTADTDVNCTPLAKAMGQNCSAAPVEVALAVLEQDRAAAAKSSGNPPRLPLHLGVLRGAPGAVMVAVLNAYPEAAMIPLPDEDRPEELRSLGSDSPFLAVSAMLTRAETSKRYPYTETYLPIHYDAAMALLERLPAAAEEGLFGNDGKTCPELRPNVLMCVLQRSVPHRDLQRHTELILKLLQKDPKAAGRDRTRDDDRAMLPLHVACMRGENISVVEALLRAHPIAIEHKDGDGMLPLHYVAGGLVPDEVFEAVLVAFPRGARERDNTGNLPLHHAAGASNTSDNYRMDRSRLVKIERLLQVDHSAASQENEKRELPILCAVSAQRKNVAAILALLNAYPDAARKDRFDVGDDDDDENAMSLLARVCSRGCGDAVLEAVLAADPGAVERACGYTLVTPLHIAASSPGTTVRGITMLLDAYPAGANRQGSRQHLSNGPGNGAKRPLDVAISGENSCSLAESDFNHKTGWGELSAGFSVFMALARRTEPQVAVGYLRFLFQGGFKRQGGIKSELLGFLRAANDGVDAVLCEGWTALALAASADMPKAFFFLLDVGANPELLDRVAVRKAAAAADPRIKRWGVEYGLLFGKYRLEPGDPKHVSQTCAVIFADMLGDTLTDGETPVALKFMWDDVAFACEVDQRSALFGTEGNARVGGGSAHDPAPCVRLIDFKRSVVADAGSEHHPFAPFAQIRLSDELDATAPTKLCHMLVMERGGGGDLTDIVSHSNIAGVNVPRVTDILTSIARCLEQMAVRGVMHGDVKGRNFVLMGAGGDWAAIDLDAAARLQSEKAGRKPTSSGFLPPEQARVVLEHRLKDVDGASIPQSVLPVASVQYDMWAFGVMAYELVTGKRLFDYNTTEDVGVGELQRIAEWTARDKQAKMDLIDVAKWPALKLLLGKLLSRDPADRPRNWGEVLAAIGRQEDASGGDQREVLAAIQKLAEESRQRDAETQKLVREEAEKTRLQISKLGSAVTNQVNTLSQSIGQQFKTLTTFISEMENVKVPFMFQFVDKTNWHRTASDAVWEAGDGGSALETAKAGRRVGMLRRLKASVKRMADPKKLLQTAIAATMKSLTLQLLCGVSLEIVHEYDIQVPNDDSAAMQALEKTIESGAKLTRAGLGIAAAWNAGAGIACMFGVPLPQVKTTRLQEANSYLKELGEELKHPDAAYTAAAGAGAGAQLGASQIEDFAAYLAKIDAGKTWESKFKRIQEPGVSGKVTWVSCSVYDELVGARDTAATARGRPRMGDRDGGAPGFAAGTKPGALTAPADPHGFDAPGAPLGVDSSSGGGHAAPGFDDTTPSAVLVQMLRAQQAKLDQILAALSRGFVEASTTTTATARRVRYPPAAPNQVDSIEFSGFEATGAPATGDEFSGFAEPAPPAPAPAPAARPEARGPVDGFGFGFGGAEGSRWMEI